MNVPCLVAQFCPTLCGPMDCSLLGSSVHRDSPGKNTWVGCHALLQGIFPTQGMNPGLVHCRQILYLLSHQGSLRILEWVVYPFSRGTSWPRNQAEVSCIAGGFFTVLATRKPNNSGVGSLSLFQGIFLTQELKWGLLNCRQILYQVSYPGSPMNMLILSESIYVLKWPPWK